MTNGTANTLAAIADVTLDTRAGPESGPSTMTFAAALVVVAAFARARAAPAAAASVPGPLADDAETAAVAAQLLVDDASLPDRIVAWHGGRATTVILGRGAARAAAEMGALTLKEVLGMPVESLQAAQFRHGPLEIAGPGLAAMVVATEEETCELDLALARELRDLGSAVLTVTAGAHDRSGDRADTIDIGPVDRLLAPAVAVMPAQLLAWRHATSSDRVPGSYVHAAKVTTRE